MSARTRLYYVAGAVVLTVAIYLAPREKSKTDGPEMDSERAGFEAVLKSAKADLDSVAADSITVLEQMLQGKTDDTALMAELGRRWDAQGQWPVSAHYFEEIARLQPGERQWLAAAYRYFDAYKSAGDSVARKQYVESAIRCYQEVLEIAPGNLDAKTDLGVCYAEGTSEPMKGIMMLREVVEKDPEHENALFNLGVLSVKSGQLDKAVGRFSKVIEIDPARKDAEFLLARCYADMGQREKALPILERLKLDTVTRGLAVQAATLYDKLISNQ